MSNLTNEIDDLHVQLREKGGDDRSDAYKAVLELTRMLSELSRKVDSIEDHLES